MTRKIVLLFLFLNISLVSAQKPCVKNDIQEFQETMQDDGNFFENKKQTILRFYLAARRSINPLVVDYALARYGIKNPKTKIVAHAVVNGVTHVAAHKALDPELTLKKLIPGALVFAGAEAAKQKLDELLEKHVMYSFTYAYPHVVLAQRLQVIARTIWNGSEMGRQKMLEFLDADKEVLQRFKSAAYSTQVGNLKTNNGAPVDFKVIINTLKEQNARNPQVSSIANALSAAQSLLHYEQGIKRNLQDIVTAYAKSKIEEKVDEHIDWAIEYIQK